MDLVASYECRVKETCDEEIRALQEEFTRYIEEASKRQQRLYAMLGVDEMITVFGQQVAECGCDWTFSTEDMRRFGIDEISAAGAEYFAETPWKATLMGVEKLRLADYPEYRSSRGHPRTSHTHTLDTHRFAGLPE